MANTSRLQLTETLIQHVNDEVDVLFLNAKRWIDAQHIAHRAAFADNNTVVFSVLRHASGFLIGGRFCCSVFYEINAEHKPASANITDDTVFVFEFLQPF